MVTGIQLVFFVGGLLLLGYLLYGAFLWITSGGEEDKVAKARNTMMYAVIGIVLLVASLVIFVVVAGNILGIIQRDEEGNIIFDLPSVTNQQNTAP
jgi:heme/copper-type cytochrome/quinol oxidase subunit 2